MTPRRLVAVLVCAGFAATLQAQQITFDRLLRADQEPHNWLMYSGNLQSHRHSRLTQITPANVRNLELQWMLQVQSLEKFEATPLVVDGVMYTVQPPNEVIALDAVTGRVFWSYTYTPSTLARPCCGRVNRGVAILGDTLFMGTLDGHVVALDAKTGRVRWNVTVQGARPEAGYTFTVAPQVVKDKVILGVGRRRLRGPRLPGGVRRRHREGNVAVLHRCPDRENRATRPGPASRGRTAAPRCG